MTVLLIGNYIDEGIYRTRALPSKNVAEANRILRLALALRAAGAKPCIVSAATAMRVGWTGKLMHPGGMKRVQGIPVAFSGNLGFSFATVLYSLVSLAAMALTVGRRHDPRIVLLYNYYPATLLAGLYCKLLYGSRLILDIEDVCKPTLSDWLGRGDPRPLQQLLGRVLLVMGRAMCNSVMVPSRRFVPMANIKGDYLLVTGCLSVLSHRDITKTDAASHINVLVSGKLDEEQGVYLALEAFRRLAGAGTRGRPMTFHICGFCDNETRLVSSVAALVDLGVSITYHGNLGMTEFSELLWQMDVCVAMQKTHGRHSGSKSPSKVYEYIANGKIVIATDVGDFRDIPSDVLTLCAYDGEALCAILRDICENWTAWEPRAERAASHASAEYSFASVGRRILAFPQRER